MGIVVVVVVVVIVAAAVFVVVDDDVVVVAAVIFIHFQLPCCSRTLESKAENYLKHERTNSPETKVYHK